MKKNQKIIEYFDKSGTIQGETPTVLIDKLVKTLKNRVKEAYFFGSFPKGDYHNESDVDIILVLVDSNKDMINRRRDFFDIFNIVKDCDLIVLTENEFDKFLDEEQGVAVEAKKNLYKFL